MLYALTMSNVGRMLASVNRVQAGKRQKLDPTLIPGERKKAGVTIARAADEMGIGREAWGSIEAGKIDVTPEYADRMAEAIDAAARESNNNGE